MNREMVVERLEMLESLIAKAGIVLLKNNLGEPDDYEKDAERLGKEDLFNEHLIRTSEKIKYIRELIKGEEDLDTDAERVFMISTMRGANRLWKLHHKVIAGEVDSIEILELEDNINDYLDKGSKINAIKYYREWMNNNTDKGCSLREAKDKIDAYAVGRNVSLI
jgi:hypothetical protein